MRKWIIMVLSLIAFAVLATGVVKTFSSASGADMKGMLAVGERYLSEERYEEAVELFSKVIEVEPNSTAAYVDRAVAYTALEEPEKALDDYRKAIEVEPDQQETLQPKIDILTGADEVNNSDNKGKELSSDELKKFETLLKEDNSNDNNCFLTCLYDRPEQMDPNEIFYSALTVLSQVAEADKAEARSLDGMSEVPEWAPINKLTRVDADAFLKRFAGMTLAQLDKKMGEGENSCFVYSQKMDAYYIVRTDTNRVSMKVQYGYVRDSGIYTIGYTAPYIGTTAIQENQLVEVSFRMVDDAPVFISNKLTENRVSSMPSASSAPAVTTSSNYYAAYAPIL